MPQRPTLQRPITRGPAPFPETEFLEGRAFAPLNMTQAAQWFERIHLANEAVYRGDGSWNPHPYSGHRELGIAIEEIALRIPGYLSAYRTTGNKDYLDRAVAAGDYLIRERLFEDGHLHLQAHLVIDFCYTLAGTALLKLWKQDRSRRDFFYAARKIGDRLVAHHFAGSINHCAIPAQLLGPLYRYTGDKKYLRAALKRVFRSAVRFQYKSGDWSGHESWYQGVNLRSLIAAYVSTPFDLANQRAKDRLAEAIVAATNWFIGSQDDTGAFPLCRWYSRAPRCEAEVVSFDGHAFRRAGIIADAKSRTQGYFGHGAYEVDALAALFEDLGSTAALSSLHGYIALLARTDRLWRLEFNTLGAGRYLEVLDRIKEREVIKPRSGALQVKSVTARVHP